jgi:hypothetical protein
MLRRAALVALFVYPWHAHAAPEAHGVVAQADDDEEDETDSGEEAKARAAEHADDDTDSVDDDTDKVAHDADDEDEGQGEDEDEHRHHGHTHHEPGLGIEWIASRARLRLGLVVQPMARYGHDSIPSPDTMDLTVRRARVAFDAEVSHGTGFHIELQAKALELGLADLYGRWALDEHIEIQAGYLHAPGGLERDTNPFDLPFLERSTLASLTRDREIGLKLVGHQENQFWQVSITRDAPLGFGGDDPDIAVPVPHGVDADKVARSATTWNQAARVGTATDDFAVAFDWTLRIRNSQADYGDPPYEPMGTVFLNPRPYRGTSIRLGLDTALAEEDFRILGEVGFRRDGQQLSYDGQSGVESRLPGHEWWTAGYLTVGWAPHGGYGRALDGAPLQWGWELLARFEAIKVKPVDAFGATMYAETVGWNWVATRQIRIEADATLQTFGEFDQTLTQDNANATRFYAELWATWRL